MENDTKSGGICLRDRSLSAQFALKAAHASC